MDVTPAAAWDAVTGTVLPVLMLLVLPWWLLHSGSRRRYPGKLRGVGGWLAVLALGIYGAAALASMTAVVVSQFALLAGSHSGESAVTLRGAAWRLLVAIGFVLGPMAFPILALCLARHSPRFTVAFFLFLFAVWSPILGLVLATWESMGAVGWMLFGGALVVLGILPATYVLRSRRVANTFRGRAEVG